MRTTKIASISRSTSNRSLALVLAAFLFGFLLAKAQITPLAGFFRPAGHVPHNLTSSPSLSVDPVPVIKIDEPKKVTWSPSIVRLTNGHLLVAFELSHKHGPAHASIALYSSRDEGARWKETVVLPELASPQMFSCRSGVYILAVKTLFKFDSHLYVVKMVDGVGRIWSEPSQLTYGISVMSTNTGVDVSNGRVSKSFEMIPSLSSSRAKTVTTETFTIHNWQGIGGSHWEQNSIYIVTVANIGKFVQYCSVIVKPLGYEGMQLFFRVMEMRPGNKLRLRYERYNYMLQNEWAKMVVAVGSVVETTRATNVYGSTDWVTGVMQANEEDDLTLAASWRFLDNFLGNPISVFSNEIRYVFDIAFRADKNVMQNIAGPNFPDINRSLALEAGFGSLYWMESVITRAQDSHGGNGKLLVISRVNNDLFCNLAAVAEVDDSQPGNLSGKFLRYTSIPGLGIAHPGIVFDDVSDLYWMATNIQRDSTRSWMKTSELHITSFSKCEIDRSMLYLFHSSNLLDWVPSGIISFHLEFNRHYSYPHMLVSGDDLLLVTRATSDFGSGEPIHKFYNNHNSNSVAFLRVKKFRRFGQLSWVKHIGKSTILPRSHY